jgi:hypothetical protein
MKLFFGLIISLILFFTVKTSFAQANYNLPPQSTYNKAKVGFFNFQRISVMSLKIHSDSIEYFYNGVIHHKSLEEINFIRVKSGNKAGSGAAIGGGMMLALSLSALIQVQADPNYEVSSNAGGLIFLYTALGAGLGAIIGSAFERERSYYVHTVPGTPHQ